MVTQHPAEAEWMEWLYGECDRARSQQLKLHLTSCATCAERVARWKRVMGELDANQLPVADPARVAVPGNVRLAVASGNLLRYGVLAASILMAAIGGAFASALLVSPQVDEGRIRLEVAQQMRGELQEFVRSELQTTKSDEQRLLPLIHDESGRVVAATLAGWAEQDSQRREKLQQVLHSVLQNQIALRQDLETLAMEAEAQILRTRRELVRVNSVAAGNQDWPPSFETEQQLPGRTDMERY